MNQNADRGVRLPWTATATLVAAFCALSAGGAEPQLMDPKLKPQQGVTSKDLSTERKYGAVSPGLTVEEVMIRGQSPELTFSDTASGRDGVIRNEGGDLRLGFFVGGGARPDRISFTQDSMTIKSDGNVGIGSDQPAHRLGIAGGPWWTTNNWRGAVEIENGAALAWKPNAAGISFGIGHTNGGFYLFRTMSNPATKTADAQYDLSITDEGTVSVRALELQGADVAENFRVEMRDSSMESMRPGFVVSIDPAHPGSLIVSDRPLDRRVAGVVSGAGGIEPGVVLAKATATGAYPIALTGRVYCWADASVEPISPGDFLTTSAILGHAMKVTDFPAAQGAMIGKAMTSLTHGTGLVLVLVTLQ